MVPCIPIEYLPLSKVVPEDSAVLRYDRNCPVPIGIYKSHREMVKFAQSSDQGLINAVDVIAHTARRALASLNPDVSSPIGPGPDPVLPRLAPGEEDPFANLGRFDTVFLVDDSLSMAGPGWTLARKILERSTGIAMQYDDNGIDIYFLNSKHNQTQVTSDALVRQTLERVTPQGGTPLGHKLQRHLQGYIDKFMEQGGRHNQNTKELNLIVIADGKPDEKYANIKRTVVRAAKDLDEERASDTQIAIQFCLIGDDQKAAEFYKTLDDDIEAEQNLQRDVSSSIYQNLALVVRQSPSSQSQFALMHSQPACELSPTLSLISMLLHQLITCPLDR